MGTGPVVSLDISFSVKELFLEIRKDLRELSSHVGELERRGSDQSQRALDRISEVEDRLKGMEERVTRLQLSSASREAIEKFSRNNVKLTWGVVIAIAGMLANVIGMFFRH